MTICCFRTRLPHECLDQKSPMGTCNRGYFDNMQVPKSQSRVAHESGKKLLNCRKIAHESEEFILADYLC